MGWNRILFLIVASVVTSGCISTGATSLSGLEDKSKSTSFKVTYFITDTLKIDLADAEPSTEIKNQKVTVWVRNGKLLKHKLIPGQINGQGLQIDEQIFYYYPNKENRRSYLRCEEEKSLCGSRTGYPPAALYSTETGFPVLKDPLTALNLEEAGANNFANQKCLMYEKEDITASKQVLDSLGFGYANRLESADTINLQLCVKKDNGAVLFSNVTSSEQRSSTEIIMEAESYQKNYADSEVNSPKTIE